MHRFVFDGQESVDVVPFGPIAGDEGVITWPPGEDSALRILGFEEAFRGALLVRVSDAPILEVRVATLAGLVIMKLVSWDDGYPDRQRDAEDLNLILESYTEAGNFERLQNEAKDLLGGDSFDYVLAGARLLGRDVGMIAVGEIRKKIETILSREMNASGQLRLPLDMAKGGLSFQDHFDQALNLLSQLQRGLLEHGSRAEGLL
jgi:predicted nucleotidyltransferase